MSETSISELISGARTDKGLTRQQLADATGYSAVMIAKIESGERLPNETRILDLAQALGIDASELKQAAGRSDRRKSGAPKIVDAMKLAKLNSARLNALKARAEHLTGDADRTARQLDGKASEFDRSVISEFAALLSRVADIPKEAIVPANVEEYQPNPEFSKTLQAAQLRTSKMIYTFMGAGLLSGGDGVTAPSGATATYLTVANLATAATGTAIGALSGAAATSGALAASGRLAATGMGLAAGTGFLTGLVVAGTVGAVAGAVLAAGGPRILSKQTSVQEQIEVAEAAFESNAQVVRKFISRASSITEILTIAVVAARNHKRAIENAVSDDRRIAWLDLEPSARASIQRTAEIVFACLTVLALPIGLDVERSAPKGALIGGVVDDDSTPPTGHTLVTGPELENEYIDYVIREVVAQVAR